MFDKLSSFFGSLSNYKEIDVFIKVVDMMHYRYVIADEQNSIYSYTLNFSFEDWSGIIGDGKKHIFFIASYKDSDDYTLVKFQNEDYNALLCEVGRWCEKHRINNE